jgi:hypothetical protein
MLYSYEIDQLFSEPNVVTFLKTQRQRWARHIVGMKEDNPAKKLTFGSRRKGWLKLRLVDDIGADLKTLGLRGWRRKALDRDKWRDVLEEAKG